VSADPEQIEAEFAALVAQGWPKLPPRAKTPGLTELLAGHHASIATQLVDSELPSTRRFWRAKLGWPELADDPRPMSELLFPGGRG
jgi:hypothetical protein